MQNKEDIELIEIKEAEDFSKEQYQELVEQCKEIIGEVFSDKKKGSNLLEMTEECLENIGFETDTQKVAYTMAFAQVTASMVKVANEMIKVEEEE